MPDRYNDPKQNYYLLLKIDPSVTDNKKIEEKIKKQERNWNSLRNDRDPVKREKAKELWLKREDIRRALLSDSAERQKYAKGARTLREEQFGDLVRGHNSVFFLRESMEDFCTESKENGIDFSESEVEGRLKLLGMFVPKKSFPLLERKDKKEIEKLLKIVEEENLYTFLGLTRDATGPDMGRKAHERLDYLNNHHKSKHSALGKELAGMALKLFENPGGKESELNKERYDNSLVERAMEGSLRKMAADGQLSAEEIENAVREAEQKDKRIDRWQAFQYICHFAEARPLLQVDWPNVDQPKREAGPQGSSKRPRSAVDPNAAAERPKATTRPATAERYNAGSGKSGASKSFGIPPWGAVGALIAAAVVVVFLFGTFLDMASSPPSNPAPSPPPTPPPVDPTLSAGTILTGIREERALNFGKREWLRIRDALVARGYPIADPDDQGLVEGMRDVIKTWQADRGLAPTGYLTETTATELGAFGSN